MGFDGEVEPLPSTSNCNNYKLPRTLLVGCGAVNHASVPRKLRSAIKKRGRESITSPLSISKKQRHVSDRADTLKKDGFKKPKPKRGHITKDEEEVAETLYALATMFFDTNKANQLELDGEQIGTKSSDIQEAGSSMNAIEDTGVPAQRDESRKISSEVTLEAICHSPNLLDSKAQHVKLESSTGGFAVGSNFGLLFRPGVSSENAIDLEQVTASPAQYGEKDHPMDEKDNGFFRSPPATGAQNSETQGSTLRHPAWFESTSFASQPLVIENSITTEKCDRVAVQSKKSWKRSLSHVYISRLIKVLQVSKKKEGSPEKPTQLKTFRGAHQMTGINGRNGRMAFNGIIDSAAERLIQDRQLGTVTSALSSAKEGYNFLSLGKEACRLDATGGINRAGQSHEAPKQFHASYVQSQNHQSMLFSLPKNGYPSSYHGHNSGLAAQQVQPPQYLSSSVNGTFTARMGRQLELQQQKWAGPIQTQYNTGGVGSSHLPDWKNGKTGSPFTVNYAQALFPHLLGSKYQQFSPQQQQQLMAIPSSSPLPNVKINQHHHHRQFSLGIERNGGTLYYENTPQLQLPCNQHL